MRGYFENVEDYENFMKHMEDMLTELTWDKKRRIKCPTHKYGSSILFKMSEFKNLQRESYSLRLGKLSTVTLD